MLVLLPVIGYFGLLAELRRRWPQLPLRLSLLRAAVLWALVVVFATEALSLFRAVTPLWLAGVWSLVLLLTGRGLWRSLTTVDWRDQLDWGLHPNRRLKLALWGSAAISAIVLLVGLLAAPNTWDALTTHMSRVAHWASHASLEHYATGIELQNYYPPFPGMAILHLYLLQSGDLLAFLPQWVAMVLSVVGVSYMAKQLGAGLPGQGMAALFAVTLPAGISQASGTMTDYLTGLWAVVVAVELVQIIRDGFDLRSVFLLAAGAGLAILTKPTIYPILGVAAVALVLVMLRRRSQQQLLIGGAVALALVFVLNAGYFLRNQQTYGNPLGLRRRVEVHAIGGVSPGAVLSNVLRNLSLHLGTPSPHVNKAIFLSIYGVHELIGQSIVDDSTSVHTYFKVATPSRHETKAGNLLHILAVPFLLIGGWRMRKETWLLPSLLAAVALAFIGFSALFKFSTFGARYHLPYFLLVAPAAGMVGERWLSIRFQSAISLLFLLASLPWVLAVESRPIISFPGDSPSVLLSSRTSTYFAYNRGLERVYVGMSRRVRGTGCQQVGVILHGSTAEYPLWPLFGAPASDVDINWIVAGTASAQYMPVNYQPCAVICQFCDETEIRGLPRVENRAGYQLYLGAQTGAVAPVERGGN